MKIVNRKKLALSCVLALGVAANVAISASAKSELQALVPQVQAWSQQSNVISAVTAGNAAHANLTKADIKKAGAEWHQGLQGKPSPILSTVNQSTLSSDLKTIQKDSNGRYATIIITDKQGLVLGQTENAPHYSLASQGIWRKIKTDGVNAVYYGKPGKKDKDVAALGLPITSHNEVIGAVVVDVNLTSGPIKGVK